MPLYIQRSQYRLAYEYRLGELSSTDVRTSRTAQSRSLARVRQRRRTTMTPCRETPACRREEKRAHGTTGIRHNAGATWHVPLGELEAGAPIRIEHATRRRGSRKRERARNRRGGSDGAREVGERARARETDANYVAFYARRALRSRGTGRTDVPSRPVPSGPVPERTHVPGWSS